MLSRFQICSGPLRAIIAALLCSVLLIQTSGCYSWHTVEQPVPKAVAANRYRLVQVVLKDQSTVTADSVRMLGDTAIALLPQWSIDDPRYAPAWAATSAIPVSLVSGLRIRQASTAKTLGLLFGIPLVGGMLWYIGFATSYGH